MKKLSLLLIITFALSCGEEDMYVMPNGDNVQVAGIVEENGSAPDNIFLVVDESPTFPGGAEAYNKYLLTNLKYPKEARDLGIEGNVYLSFIVNKDGSLSDYEIARSLGGGLDEEALRVFMAGPDWTPGRQNGKEVRTRMMTRIVFKKHSDSASSISINNREKVEEIVFLDVEKK